MKKVNLPILFRGLFGGLLCGTATALYFYNGVWSGVHAFFTTDDLANLMDSQRHSVSSLLQACAMYFSPAYRPLGGLFYHVFYARFGFHPYPFRLACLVFLAVDLAVAWRFTAVVTRSIGIAAVSTLLIAFHPRLAALYWSTGTVYDILCFGFYYAALGIYCGIRLRGRFPNVLESLLLLVLLAAALDAKEVAVALPLLALLFEFVFDPPEWRLLRNWASWIARNARIPLAGAVLTIPYLIGKLQPASVLSQFDRYRPHIGLRSFLFTYGAYLDQLLYRDHWFSESRTAGLLLILLVVAAAVRSRVLVFAWMLAIVGALPIAFIPPRDASAFYVPLLGWSLYAATIASTAGELVFRHLPSRTAAFQELAVFAVVLALLLRVHRIQRQRMDGPEILDQHRIRDVAAELDRRGAKFASGARVLSVGDPFSGSGGSRNELRLLLELYSGDPNLQLDHAASTDCLHAVTLRWNGTELAGFQSQPRAGTAPAGECSASR